MLLWIVAAHNFVIAADAKVLPALALDLGCSKLRHCCWYKGAASGRVFIVIRLGVIKVLILPNDLFCSDLNSWKMLKIWWGCWKEWKSIALYVSEMSSGVVFELLQEPGLCYLDLEKKISVTGVIAGQCPGMKSEKHMSSNIRGVLTWVCYRLN